jgi:2-polyprenyl-3-methyl-5-hydroxy-6-metoxy-1,4-benzoquinol methylase
MNSQLQVPISLKLYYRSRDFLSHSMTFINGCFIRFWLGVLPKYLLHLADQDYYNKTKMYCSVTYNQQGLWEWEKHAIETYFKSCESLMLIGAGGGREVYALSKLGYQVDGYECNPQLVEFANQLAKADSLQNQVIYLERDDVPKSDRLYDGVIVGWGAYMLIQGKTNRVSFLQQIKTRISANAPILISFYHHDNKSHPHFQLVVKVGNVLRRLLRRELLEIGDDLSPEFVHYFNRDQILAELEAGGFEMVMYGTHDYGHAVGIAR